MASEIPEIVHAFGPQLKALWQLEFCLSIFAVTCSSLSEDRAVFRYVPLYIAGQVEFRCSFPQELLIYSNLNFTYEEDYNSFSTTEKKKTSWLCSDIAAFRPNK